MDYIQYLQNQLSIIKNNLGIEQNIIVEEELIYSKKTDEELIPNNIYIVLKNLQADITNEGLTQPIQILVVSEINSSDNAIALMTEFSTKFNWVLVKDGTTLLKQQYSTPIVMNNFEEIGIGYRSVLFLTGTLFILKDILDIQDLTIDGEEAVSTRSTISYVLTTDTEQFPNSNIAMSVKNSATISLTLSIIFKKTAFMKKVFKIMNGTSTGAETFAVSFKLDETDTDYSFSQNLVLQNAQITGSINDFPTIQLSFIK